MDKLPAPVQVFSMTPEQPLYNFMQGMTALPCLHRFGIKTAMSTDDICGSEGGRRPRQGSGQDPGPAGSEKTERLSLIQYSFKVAELAYPVHGPPARHSVLQSLFSEPQ